MGEGERGGGVHGIKPAMEMHVFDQESNPLVYRPTH